MRNNILRQLQEWSKLAEFLAVSPTNQKSAATLVNRRLQPHMDARILQGTGSGDGGFSSNIDGLDRREQLREVGGSCPSPATESTSTCTQESLVTELQCRENTHAYNMPEGSLTEASSCIPAGGGVEAVLAPACRDKHER